MNLSGPPKLLQQVVVYGQMGCRDVAGKVPRDALLADQKVIANAVRRNSAQIPGILMAVATR